MDGHRLPERRSIRLRGYDYGRTGAYFVTLCAYRKECLLGRIDGNSVELSDIGAIVASEWQRTAAVRPGVFLDAFVVMPNHLHAIVVIDNVGATRRVARPACGPRGPRASSLGAIIGQFKSAVSKRVAREIDPLVVSIWQRNYYEHVVRNDEDLRRIRQYILDNPAQWALDEENPINWPHGAISG